jgi:excisionase family DNA binding protein
MATLTATPVTTTLPATMTVRETSKLLGISLRATYRLIEAGQLPVLRTGRRIHVITHKLYAMLGIPLDQATDDDAYIGGPDLEHTTR